MPKPAPAPLVYPSLLALIEDLILPQFVKNPRHERLDDRKADDTWQFVVHFSFDGEVWQVPVDNHYEPLLLAYWSARFRGEDKTFVSSGMKTRDKLELAADLLAIRAATEQHIYQYTKQRAA